MTLPEEVFGVTLALTGRFRYSNIMLNVLSSIDYRTRFGHAWNVGSASSKSSNLYGAIMAAKRGFVL